MRLEIADLAHLFEAIEMIGYMLVFFRHVESFAIECVAITSEQNFWFYLSKTFQHTFYAKIWRG
eukprot:TRINITY_DN14151_c0_g1_i1.p3 TRINITY_DN14151_c0_g1~~TRINITY_DN14151_c0_g1_i1.p3  ORF type:complete len:64 (+),score=0.46 TRINITY_DN14151_c0_g1_i1:425-616(+)